MTVQTHFWKEFFQTKMQAAFVELHLGRTEQTERYLNLFLAFASSGSVGAWIVWKEYGFVWALVIAISQVVTAVREHLPYRERLKAYAALLHDLQELALHAEMKWLDISRGMLTETEIANCLADIRSRKHKATKKHLPSSVIPADTQLQDAAEKLANDYFAVFYEHEMEA